MWYPDNDGDGFGASTGATGVKSVGKPAGCSNCVPDNRDLDDDYTNDALPCITTLMGQSSLDCSSSANSKCAKCVHPGATEVCDGVDNNCDGVTDEKFDNCPRDYQFVGTNNYNNNWVDITTLDTTNCPKGFGTITDFTTSGANKVTLPFDFKFYSIPLTNRQIYVCKLGYLSITSTCPYTSSLISPNSATLTNNNVISPYMSKSTRTPSYCFKDNLVVFKWTDGTYDSEAILYNDGRIIFSYYDTQELRSTTAEVGISNGIKNKEAVKIGSQISNSYEFIDYGY
jgi:hypothetical protein